MKTKQYKLLEDKSQMTTTKINEIELTLLCSVNHINTNDSEKCTYTIAPHI